MANLVGTGLNQVPSNSMLGGLAYQSPDNATIRNLDLKNISQINAQTGDTAVDVFVYDTSKDSDGGAWRKRTSHTSWYNETLNTTTRGSRRDFPAVAVIVGSTTTLTIYDGDDPDLPMWMVFNRGVDASPTWLWDGNNANNLTSVSALNGIMMFSTSSAGSYGADFIGERWIYFYNGATFSGFRYNGGGIINRNSAVSARTVTEQFSTAAAGAQHHDIAMVVLPNTPIDSVTGIPFPTIAVGSNNGVNIINSDKTVIATGNSGYPIKKINFTSDYGLNCHIDNSSSSNKALVYVNEFYRISGLPYDTYNNWDGVIYATKYDPKALTYRTGGAGSAYPISDFISLGGRQSAIGTNESSTGGLTFVEKSPKENFDPDSGMVAFATTSYNTGWMHGDIKGAFLSGISTESVTGTELVTNGDFSSGTTGWTANGSGSHTFSVVSGTLQIVRGASGLGAGEPYQNITLTSGKTYILSWQVTSGDVTTSLYDGTIGGSTLVAVNSGGVGYFSRQFTVSTTGTKQLLIISNNANSTTAVDNVSIREAELDRSINDKGLQIFGTITKTAVATGADLVAYSGWSDAVNYLRHRSSTNYGSSATVTFMAWQKTSDVGDYQYAASLYDPTSNKEIGISIGSNVSGYSGVPYIYDATNGVLQGGSISIADGTWHFVVGILNGTTRAIYVDGVLRNSAPCTAVNLAAVTYTNVGHYTNTGNVVYSHRGSLALVRILASAPSPDQIKKIYEDEKALFQENSKATLYGTSSAVTALAYDHVTKRLHVGTSSGRSEFQGLERINNTTTAVTTAISVYDTFVVEQ